MFWLHAKKNTKRHVFSLYMVWRHRSQPPSQAGVGFGLGSGSPVCFLPELGRRGIKLRRHQGPTGGGVLACLLPVVGPPTCAPTNGRPGFPFGFLGAGGRLPKARRGRVFIVQFFFFFFFFIGKRPQRPKRGVLLCRMFGIMGVRFRFS